MSVSVEGLFKEAVKDKVLSPLSMQTITALDVGAHITAALGVPALQANSSEVVVVTLNLDDSTSIKARNNTQAVIDGHNLVLDALTDPDRLSAGQIDSIFAHAGYLNGKILYPYCNIRNAVKMTAKNYDPYGGTPLYDQAIVTLSLVVGKAQEYLHEGVLVRTITLIVTDGHDEHSIKATPREVKQLVEDMLKQECHIIAGMGIDDGETDFREIFRSMGFLDKWILTPKNTEHDIREAFRLFSQSAQTGSQNTKSFSTLGGFGK